MKETPFNSFACARAPAIRLEFLDGIRGLSALYVTIFHAWMQVDWRAASTESPVLYYSMVWMGLGRQAVAVFIVLSGFCLMLPVARSSNGAIQGGALAYFKRRAWRILPPYFAALAVSLAVMALIPRFVETRGTWFSTMEPAFGLGNILAHALLIHNLSAEWVYKINAPMWSVAMEWQIYFIFPFLLIPLWKHFGALVTICVAFAIGLSPLFFLGRLSWTAPWFVGHFALGMAGAVIGHSKSGIGAKIREMVPLGAFTLACFVALLVVQIASHRIDMSNWKYAFLNDLIVGFGATSLIVYCLRNSRRKYEDHSHSFALKVLGSRAPVALGRFSYSLYLIHGPVLASFFFLVREWEKWPLVTCVALVGAGVPLSLALSYGFYLLFEKPVVDLQKSWSKRELIKRAIAPQIAS